jgi:glycosyltransferase involved in cell wall biosynthesis
MSALACEPGRGSELEVGYRAMLAAAGRHEVWVLTNAESVPAVAAAIAGSEQAARIHLEGIEFGLDEEAFGRLTVPGFHWYYDRWQRRAAARAVELDREVDFDLVHHVTLAIYWTRAGAAVLDKPLVWGPVGGGVETPWRLIPELAWRGVAEDIGRVLIRRAMGRVGPARRAQRKASIVFAQNKETARRLDSRGEGAILTNAVAIDLEQVHPSAPRSKDIYLVGRLVPWKAPALAVRTMRYIQDPDCILRICGDGPEHRRLEQAARRWGVQDRVSFQGWLPRDVLLERLASAGALIHPALHEEAGLCIAEALAVGTPVVCLDRGGPAAVLAEWPEASAVAVEPATAAATARAMAAAIDRFLADPPEVRRSARRPRSSFEAKLWEAYDRAARRAPVPRHRLRPAVWAFPRGKPQLFANTASAIGDGISVYAFGRPVPRAVQAVAAAQVRLPGLRSVLAQWEDRPNPVCGWELWDDILAHAEQVAGRRAPEEWVYFRSQWAKQRSSALALDGAGGPLFLVVVEPRGRASIHPTSSAGSFQVPACLGFFDHDGWRVRVVEPLPRYHRAAGWDPVRIRDVAEDIPKALDGLLPEPADMPAHWRPLHGDFVPWNLRADRHGGLWLVDWEDARWGPPLADAVRYLVAHQSLRKVPPRMTARTVHRTFDEDAVDLREVATFWMRHRNLGMGAGPAQSAHGTARDATRAAREIDAFRIIAGDPEHTG